MCRWFCLLVFASASPAEGNWLGCSAGPVGDCAFLGCLPTRGPTQCIGNKCMCQDGYCEYGSMMKRCRAEVPWSSCHISHACWKGGVVSSTCVDGHCLCRFGMGIKDGVCSFSSGTSMLDVTNATNMELHEELDSQERFEVFLNVLAVSAWFSIAAGLLVASAAFVRKTVANRRVQADLEHRLLA
eukprot:TRINITY_DN124349_c0_g1_i1.p1 TRINITY_DN124349_c0_g1~~TRINITY_DN124349_c0_g1_i1.p1  ORF type:complete len:212 (-),score=26.54 TRINITY_DN124349_c0_g1_i1:201-755(-)